MPRLKRLSRKQKHFADLLLKNPKMTGTDAALAAYGVKDAHNASVVASEVLNNTMVQTYLLNHDHESQATIVDLMKTAKTFAKQGGKDGASYAGVALSAAKDIQDRVHGKATQRIQQSSTAININIDLGHVT